MRSLTTAELLQTWEDGLGQSLLEKTIRLLGRACAVEDYALLCKMSIGERDARLLQIREWMFGNRLKNMAGCPNCKALTEWETNTRDLYLQQIPPAPAVRTFSMEKEGYTVLFRLPDTNDVARALTDISRRNDPEKILADCLLESNKDGNKITAEELPASIWQLMNERMEKEDPQADINMKIACPVCNYEWEARFDIAGYLWAEINNWAQRIMQEVYLLARSFGWAEKDILNMSSRRRQLYLQMAGV